MSLTITFTPSVGSPVSYVLSDDAYTALDTYRLTLAANPTPGAQIQAPADQLLFPTVEAMLVSLFSAYLIQPALDRTPPAAVTTARATLATAQAGAEAAMAAALQSALTPAA